MFVTMFFGLGSGTIFAFQSFDVTPDIVAIAKPIAAGLPLGAFIAKEEFANAIAPEHITVDSEEDVEYVTAAGSVFVGNWSAQSVGDYASGPNHTLPTGAAARFRGGLSVLDFLKVITVQQLSREGLEQIAGCVTALANAEGLKAHAEAVHIRSRQ